MSAEAALEALLAAQEGRAPRPVNTAPPKHTPAAPAADDKANPFKVRQERQSPEPDRETPQAQPAAPPPVQEPVLECEPGVDPEIDRQATEMAKKALQALPEAARASKLLKVKQGILKRLLKEAAEKPPAPKAAAVAPAVATSEVQTIDDTDGAPPPPPPPPDVVEEAWIPPNDGAESVGDEPWFGDIYIRRALRESVAEAHKTNKIDVKDSASEIARIWPGDGRVVLAGGVLRLGGAHLGGFGEADIAYAYRQLSRALHPDKNADVAEAPDAFKRLSEAAEELRQSLADSRKLLEAFCATMGREPAKEIMERPQEGLFAEGFRLMSAVVSYGGEGLVLGPAAGRAAVVFASSSVYPKCDGKSIINDWYNNERLLDMFASAPLRAAYDCAPKRYRIQFLCMLNRVLRCEAVRQNDCIRSPWQAIVGQFPELGLWREFLDRVKNRVWTLDEEEKPAEEKKDEPMPDAEKEKAEKKDEPMVIDAEEKNDGKSEGAQKRGDDKSEKKDNDKNDDDKSKADGDNSKEKKAAPWECKACGEPNKAERTKCNGCGKDKDYEKEAKAKGSIKALIEAKEKEGGEKRKPEPRPRPRKRLAPEKNAAQIEGTKDDPVCWNYVTKGFCRTGERCKYMHSFPQGYDAQKARDAVQNVPKLIQKESLQREREDRINRRRKPDPKTSSWAKWWREVIRCVLPLSAEAAAPYRDLEARKVSMALWQDLVKWVGEDPADVAAQQVLGLFRAEACGRVDPAGVIQRKAGPCGGDLCEWAFVPAVDILLVVGEGIVGATVEGVMADGPVGYRRETFDEARARLNCEASEDVVDDNEVLKARFKEARKQDDDEVEEVKDGEPAKKLLRPTKRLNAAPDKDYPEGDIKPGTRVKLHGLVVTKSVNGMVGHCEKWDSKEGRWLVMLTDGSTATVRPDNLMVMDDAARKSKW